MSDDPADPRLQPIDDDTGMPAEFIDDPDVVPGDHRGDDRPPPSDAVRRASGDEPDDD